MGGNDFGIWDSGVDKIWNFEGVWGLETGFENGFVGIEKWWAGEEGGVEVEAVEVGG